MAKLTKQKARKEYECCKCKRIIKKGEIYQKIIEMYRKPRTVCNDCLVPRSELTSSDYLAWLFDMQDSFVIDTPESVQELIDSLEEQRSELEDKLYNIPEQLQDGEAGTVLQERIEILEDAISQLEDIEFDDSEEEMQEELEDKLDNAREILMSL